MLKEKAVASLGQSSLLMADEARLLLARVLCQRTFEFDLLAEHAAFTHALAEGLCDALENPGDPAQTQSQVMRSKNWERQADQLLTDARQRAERRPRWLPVLDCLEKADDVADALEEATFMHSLTLIHPAPGLPAEVRAALCQLAATTLAAIQDQIKAIEIARQVSQQADGSDSELFLQTLWRMLVTGDDPDSAPAPLALANPACSGVVSGAIALDAQAVERLVQQGVPTILVRQDAETSDIAALQGAQGLLTQRGARTSHAAVVARQMGKTCLVGCAALHINEATRTVHIGSQTLAENDLITLDGNDGAIYAGQATSTLVPDSALRERLATLRSTQHGKKARQHAR